MVMLSQGGILVNLFIYWSTSLSNYRVVNDGVYVSELKLTLVEFF